MLQVGGLSLVRWNEEVLHFLSPQGELLVGDGGWGYALNREGAEPIVAAEAARNQPDLTYNISPRSTGPSVFGIFVGRTPAQGIGRVLKIPVHAATSKAKWRLTLYQDERTKEPTTYKVEGSLFRGAAREGRWSREASPERTLYRLEGEPLLLLEKAEDAVFFFLDGNGRLLTGNADFSYALYLSP